MKKTQPRKEIRLVNRKFQGFKAGDLAISDCASAKASRNPSIKDSSGFLGAGEKG